MGKAYANRKKESERPKGDYYPTPKSLVYKLLETNQLDKCKTILEPAYGSGAISNILKEKGFKVTEKDLIYGNDFLLDDYSNQHFDAIVTNPPFSLYDEFIQKAKTIDCNKIIMIGRTNHFGSHKTNVNGIWKGLSDVYIFDRQVAYDREWREDGKFYCGCLVSGWFIWTKGYTDLPKLHIMDVNNWAYRKSENNNKKDIFEV